MSNIRLFLIEKLIDLDPEPKSLFGKVLDWLVSIQVVYEKKKYG